jgi:hypothetical protein
VPYRGQTEEALRANQLYYTLGKWSSLADNRQGNYEDMENTHYTLDEIKIYWNKYWTLSGLRSLVKGKWQYDFSGKVRRHIDATAAEVTLLRNHMSFPTFLEKYGK